MSNRWPVGSRIVFWALFPAALLAVLGLSGCGNGGQDPSSSGEAIEAANMQASALVAADPSPDGSTIAAPNGSLVTTAGTWTWGTATSVGGNAILLNGQLAGGGYGTNLYVLNGGKVYTYTKDSKWFLWSGTGWGQVAPPVTEPAAAPARPTVSLTANPTSVTSGGGSTLTWSSTNATSCTASGGWSGTRAVSGSASVSGLTSSTTYSLACTGASGTASASTTVTVTAPPPTGLSADGSTIAAPNGSLVTTAGTWTWGTATSTGGNAILLNGQSAAGGYAANLYVLNGGKVYAYTKDSKWYLWSGSWSQVSSPTTAPPSPPPGTTVSLTANPTSVTSGGGSTLTWSSTNSTSCTASGGWSGTRAVSGSASVSGLTSTTTYSLACTGASGTASTSTTVTVTGSTGQSPDGTTIAAPNGSLITTAGTWTWGTATSTGGNAILLNGQSAAGGYATNLYVLNGGKVYAYTRDSKWYLWSGSWSQVASPTTPPPPPPATTVSLTANPTSVASGGSSTLTWSSTNATSCSASGGWSGSRAVSGSESTSGLTSTSTYSLACTGANGTASASTTVTVAGTPPSGAYTTSFNLTENPISEGGKWINGKAAGVNWNNVRTTPGKAFGAVNVSGYDDDIAVLTTNFAANQYAQGTVSRASGYSPGVSHEVELLLHFKITANSARGYEVLWGATGEVNIVRWNGPLGDYTPLLSTYGPNIGAARDGDVLRAEIINNVIRVYKNGSLVLTGPTNTTWPDGQPGIGFWPTSGSTPANYGWKNFEAGNL